MRKQVQSKDSEVQSVWSDTLISAIRYMSVGLVESEVG
jgi:hypothetical protein